MDKLKKVNIPLTHTMSDKLKEVGFNGLNVGDKIYYKHGGECTITKINKKGVYHMDKYSNEEKYESCISFDDLKQYYIPMEQDLDYQGELLSYITNPKEYKNKQRDLIATTKESDTTALIVSGGVQDMITAQGLMQRMTDKMRILDSMLDNYRSKFNSLRIEFQDKLNKINKVIQTLEIYMGIDEEITQIQEGKYASESEPICFRQQLLFMDEEIALADELFDADINKIEDFDNWLLKDKNYEKLVPEEKCVVAMRVRRNDKDYGEVNLIVKMMMDNANKKTFVLIRNGENIYRIWTEQFRIYPRLFPKIDEFDKVMKEIEKRQAEGWSGESEKEELEEKQLYYKFHVLMMQGLIDRTEIFKPMKEGVNLFNPLTYGDSIKLIFDDENTISSGRPSFDEYINEINSKIHKGSRIVTCLDGYRKDYDDRFKRQYKDYTVPAKPSDDVYEVESVETFKEFNGAYFSSESMGYVIRYNPGGEVINYWDRYDRGHERKNKVQFFLYGSDIIFNYDLLDLDIIEYYLQDRVERKNYLHMFPILKVLKKLRAEELKWEKEFVRLVVDRNQVSEEIVWKAVEWWKFKNMWKRPIRKDDAKALRMIERRIKK